MLAEGKEDGRRNRFYKRAGERERNLTSGLRRVLKYS